MGSLSRTISPRVTGFSGSAQQGQNSLAWSEADTFGTVTRALTRSPAFSGAVTPTSASYIDTAITGGVQYTYSLVITDARGLVSASQSAQVTATDSGGASTTSDLFAAFISGTPRAYDTDAVITYYSKCAEGLYGVWDGWQQGRIRTLAQVDAAIKALNPGFKSGSYMEPNFGSPNGSGADSEQFNFINNNNLWLFLSGASGTKVNSFWSASYWMYNLYYPTMSGITVGGLTIYQWLIRYWSDYSWAGNAYGLAGSTNAATGLNALFTDDLLWRMSTGGSYITGAYTRSGTLSGDNASIAQGWRQGLARTWTELLALSPTKEIWVNGSQLTQNEATGYSTEYANKIDLLWDEGTCGYSHSPETWGGTNFIINSQGPKARAAVKAGGKTVFHQAGLTASYTDPTDATPYRCTRYSYALSKMAGYDRYAMSFTNVSDYDVNLRGWIDELSVNSSGVCNTYPSVDAGMGWLGAALGSATQNLTTGIWTRDYANGRVLVNPKGNGTQSFTMGGSASFKRLSGSQVPAINSGATVGPSTTIAMAARDGLFLYRVS